MNKKQLIVAWVMGILMGSLIYFGTIFIAISILRFLDDYLRFIPYWLKSKEHFWFWVFIFTCLFGYPFYRKKREVIKGLPAKIFLWLKSLNWNKEDYKKIIIGMLLIILAVVFIVCPLIRSINGIDIGSDYIAW